VRVVIQQGYEHADDRDHDEQFDECEPVARFVVSKGTAHSDTHDAAIELGTGAGGTSIMVGTARVCHHGAHADQPPKSGRHTGCPSRGQASVLQNGDPAN
jgi:hypothetical protein